MTATKALSVLSSLRVGVDLSVCTLPPTFPRPMSLYYIWYHLVHALLKEPDCGPIFALSRNLTVNLQDKVTYLAGDIADITIMQNLIREIQPRVISHTASPLSRDGTIKGREFVKTNVVGTKNLLDVAASVSSVRAVVYTCSGTVYAGLEHIDLDES